jgi:hypothetical protein
VCGAGVCTARCRRWASLRPQLVASVGTFEKAGWGRSWMTADKRK